MIFGFTVSDEFRKCPSYWLIKASTGATTNRSETDMIARTASIFRTRVLTVNGLRINQNLNLEAINGLEGLLRTTQKLNPRNLPFNEIVEIRRVTYSETFVVCKCIFKSNVIAVKHIRLHENESNSNCSHFQRRLQAVFKQFLSSSLKSPHHVPSATSLSSKHRRYFGVWLEHGWKAAIAVRRR